MAVTGSTTNEFAIVMDDDNDFTDGAVTIGANDFIDDVVSFVVLDIPNNPNLSLIHISEPTRPY